MGSNNRMRNSKIREMQKEAIPNLECKKFGWVILEAAQMWIFCGARSLFTLRTIDLKIYMSDPMKIMQAWNWRSCLTSIVCNLKERTIEKYCGIRYRQVEVKFGNIYKSGISPKFVFQLCVASATASSKGVWSDLRRGCSTTDRYRCVSTHFS